MTKKDTEEQEFLLIKETIISRLKCIYDPEIPVNIFDMGLIYDITLERKNNYLYCTITMTLTSPGCPVADTILSEVNYHVSHITKIDEVGINLVFQPMWNHSFVSEEGKEILALEGNFFYPN